MFIWDGVESLLAILVTTQFVTLASILSLVIFLTVLAPVAVRSDTDNWVHHQVSLAARSSTQKNIFGSQVISVLYVLAVGLYHELSRYIAWSYELVQLELYLHVAVSTEIWG